MKRIIEARGGQSKKFQTENAEKIKAASAAIQDAYKSKDKDTIAKATKEYTDLYAPFYEAMKKSQADLMNVLTPEQKAQWGEYQLMSSVKAGIAPVELTEDQIKKIRESCAELFKADNPFSNYAKVQQKVQEVLTDEQKATIAKNQAIRMVQGRFWMAKLTADQMNQVRAAYDELAKDKDLKPADVQKKLAEKIDGLLTDEQKESMKKAPTWQSVPGAAGAAAPGTPINPRATEK